MDVSLTPELDEFIAEMVRSGLYSSAGEVIREGLRLLKEQEELRLIRLQELKREISVGIEQLENGRGKTYKSAAALIGRVKAVGRKRHGAAAGGKKRK